MSFVQLQVISTNSLMKSTLTIEDLVMNAKKSGYNTLALTDHNVLIGAIEFYEKALQQGIKPIIGLTLDVQGYANDDQYYPLILLAKNREGYQELIQLSTQYQLSDEEYVTLSDVIMRSEHLIVISPGEKGELISLVNNDFKDEAIEWTQYFSSEFPNYYQGVSLQNTEREAIEFLKELPVTLVGLGNVQYLNSEDAMPSRVLRVLESGISLNGEEQAKINQFLSIDEGDYSLQGSDIVYERFKKIDLDKAAKETVKIANQVHIELELDQISMPSFPVPKGETSDRYLRGLCEENLSKRVDNVTDVYIQRLNKELDVISKMGFSDYFLIVWDIMVYAHKQNIYTGSGRGSAAGSLVAFLLEITNADPIEFDLLFERFLNEERFTLPDIDLDFPDNHREQILQYIFNQYGMENVAQIGTIGTYGAKSAVRDVGRVLGISQDEIKKWASAIPSGPNVTLESALKNKRMNDLVSESEQNRKIYEIASKIEGANRHVSTHAAGVVISDHPLTLRVPLQKGSGNIYLTQYTMDAVEKVGLLKLDILSLRNLSILSDCIRFIPFENNGRAVDIDEIPFDDQETLEIFRKGNTDGVFQFESDGIRRVLTKLQPNSFEDVVAVNALYRPGPMEQIDTFINRKNGTEPIEYPHEDLKEILEPTYGVMVYQEQVMRVATKLAGYTLNEADILRRAIGKKDHQAIEEGRKEFVAGALKNNYSKETALAVYGYIEKFADYGFNRSHAVAYSKVAYQLAYVKANYPASFFAAIMKASGKAKIKSYVAEAKQYGVEIMSPDINQSYYSFILENGKIRFGFDTIKGVPRNFIQEIIDERKSKGKFSGLIDFLSRINKKWLNEDQILPFIYSGALDSFDDTRSSLLHSLPSIVDSVEMSHGNVELFEIFAPAITDKKELTDDEKMKQEFETTGYYFTAEPGEKYNALRENKKIRYLADVQNERFVQVLAVVENIKSIQTKKGKPMSFVDVVDNTGKGNLTLFPNVHRRFIQKFDTGDTILVEGKVEKNQTPVKIIVNKIKKADELIEELSTATAPTESQARNVLYIRFQSLEKEQKKFEALQKILKQFHGQTPVVIYDESTKKQHAFKKEFFADTTPELLDILRKMFANDNILLRTVKNERK